MKFFLPLNVKMQTFDGILTFMGRKTSILGLILSLKKLNFLIFLYLQCISIKFHAQLS